MGDSATWWLLASVALGSGAVAAAAALSDTARARLATRRRRALPAGADVAADIPVAPPPVLPIPPELPAPLAPSAPAQAAGAAGPAPPAPTADGPPATAPPVTAPAGTTGGYHRAVGRAEVVGDPAAAAPQQVLAPPSAPLAASAPVPPLIVAAGASPPPVPTPTPPANVTPTPLIGLVVRASTVEVRVLGSFEVRAPGMPGAHRDTLATLIAMAAVNPAGVPRPVVEQLLPGPEVMAEAAQQAKGWLGLDDTGQPRLREQDGAWRLSPDVWVDWRAFHHLAAPSAGPDDPRRIAEALAMIRGELFVGVSLPAAAQELLRPVVDEIRSVVAGAVEREIRSALAAGDADRAGRALRQGLLLLPREGSLWRLQLEL